MEITLLSRYFNTNNGGIGRYSKELLSKMLENGHTVNPIQTLSEGGVGYNYYTYISLLKELKIFNKGADIYHALTPMEAIHTPKNKTVTTYHDLIPILYSDRQNWHTGILPQTIQQFIGKKVFQYACEKAADSERILANSEQTKKEVIQEFGVDKSRIDVVRLGIDKDLRPVPTAGFDKYRIGTLSYLSPRKRVDVLINAFKEMDREDAELIIGGKGERMSDLKELAGDDPRISFQGYVPEEKMNEFYNSLDVFVFPTILEGYGLPAVEAMATATPVITLDDAIMPSDVQRHTEVVPKNDLGSVLEERSWDVDIEAGLEFADLHDWDRVYRETKRIYEEVES